MRLLSCPITIIKMRAKPSDLPEYPPNTFILVFFIEIKEAYLDRRRKLVKILAKSLAQLRETFGEQKDSIVIKPPGRVNLLGKHTDYNEGFLLPSIII